eukprot:tig00021621_g22981.t1
MAAFALVFRCGGTMFLKTVGIDYSVGPETRAYFNLYYALIELAIRGGCAAANLGPSTYQVKCALGAEKRGAGYCVDLVSALSRPLGPLLRGPLGARLLASLEAGPGDAPDAP